MPELGVPVRVLLALHGLGVALQAVAQTVQQLPDPDVTDPMPGGGQRIGQVPGRLRRPPQRRHRVPASDRVDQGVQRRQHAWVGLGQGLATTTGLTDPTLAPTRSASQHLGDPSGHRRPRDPSRRHHPSDPTTAQFTSLGTQQQPALPLIELRQQHRELRHQRLVGTRRRHTSNLGPPGRRTCTRNYTPVIRNQNVISFRLADLVAAAASSRPGAGRTGCTAAAALCF